MKSWLSRLGPKMRSRMYALLLLFRQAHGFSSKLKIALSVPVATLLSSLLRRRFNVALSVDFGFFRLCFRPASNELTPVLEISRDYQTGRTPFIPFDSPEREDIKRWTVLDVGANIGIFSMFFRDANRIIAIEPNPDCYGRLCTNFKINGVRGVTINKAVSRSEEPVRMQFPGASTHSAVVNTGGCYVPSTSIDSIVAEHSVERIDLVKIDVEGHEIQVLEGAQTTLRNGIIKRIYIEFNSIEANAKHEQFLSRYGFTRSHDFAFNSLFELT